MVIDLDKFVSISSGGIGSDNPTTVTGTWRWRGTYNPATAYAVGDVVAFNGGSYVCLVATTGVSPQDGTPTFYWDVAALPGTLNPDVQAQIDADLNTSASNAGVAAQAATAAGVSAGQSAASAGSAASSADIAVSAVAAKSNYATVAAGLAATTTGQSFSVSPSTVDTTALYDFYRNTAGAATYLGSGASQSTIDGIAKSTSRGLWSRLVGQLTPTVYQNVVSAGTKLLIGLRSDGQVDIGPVTNITGRVTRVDAAVVDYPSRSGWLWAVFGQFGTGKKLLLGINKNNDVMSKGFNLTQAASAIYSQASRGWQAALITLPGTDKQRRILVGVDYKGDLISKGRNISQGALTVAAMKPLVAASNFMQAGIVSYGDSLTQNLGNTGPTLWQQQVATILGTTSYNQQGVGGQQSIGILQRLGARPMPMTFADQQNVMPTSGSISGATDGAQYSNAFLELYGVRQGTLAGFHGTLNASDDGSTFTFTPDAGAYPTVPTPIAQTEYFQMDLIDETIISGIKPFIPKWPTVIVWMGRNDLNHQNLTDYLNNVQYFLEYMRQQKIKQFLLIGCPNGSTEANDPTQPASQAVWINWRSVMAQVGPMFIAAGFDPRQFLDISPIIWRSGDPTLPQDVADMKIDIPPTSLRMINSDGTINTEHYSAAGYTVIAKAVANRIKQLQVSYGWTFNGSTLP